MKDLRGYLQKLTEAGTPQATLFFTVLGLIVAVLLLLIGFWKTVLVIVCCLIGYFLGAVTDKAGFFRRIITRFYRIGQ